MSRSGEPGPVDESDLTWAELSEKMQQERLEHERLRRQDADVIRDLKMSEDMMIQLLDLRAKSFNSERCRLIEELNSVCVVHISREFSIHFDEISIVIRSKIVRNYLVFYRAMLCIRRTMPPQDVRPFVCHTPVETVLRRVATPF